MCTSCQKCVHKKCTCINIKGSTSKVMKSFNCRHCMNTVTSTGHTSVFVGVSANLELVHKLSYSSDMLSADGDADAPVETRIRIRCNKVRQLIPLLTSKDI